MFARCFLTCVVALVASLPVAAQDQPASREAAARAFVELLNRGEFAKASESFDEAMLKALPQTELKKTWEKLVADAGAFVKPLSSRQTAKDKYDVVFVTCQFAKMTLDAKVVFDKDAKISGLFFTPTKKPLPTGKEEIYEGALKIGALELRLAFRLFQQKDGSYAGVMDSVTQNVKDLVLDEATIKNETVHLELRSAKIVFDGKRSDDGSEIVGTFNQAGSKMPLTLKRVAKASELRRPQTPKKPYPYDEVEVTYASAKGAVTLAGTLTVPRTGGPFPAVLLITGSGPQDRDESIMGHKPFLVLADHLTRRGIAVLRADDRGVGKSTGKFADATLADFADDVRAGIDFLKSRREINPARIGLIGHSEGGIVAPLVASRSADVAFIVMLAGTGLPGDEILLEQGAAILKTANASAERLAMQKEMQVRMFAVLRAEMDAGAAEKKLHAALEEFTSKLGPKEKQEVLNAQPLLEGHFKMALTPWFRDFMDHDPRRALRRVTCPVLALNGGKDVQVVAQTNLTAIAAALKQANNPDVTTKEFPHLNHLFQTCKTGAVSEYGSIEETIAPEVLETIAAWIARRTIATVAGADPQFPKISAERMKATVDYLSSDRLEGRGLGTRGEVLTTEYLVDEFKKAGLKPLGERDSYYQSVPLVRIVTSPKSTLQAIKGDVTLDIPCGEGFAGRSQTEKELEEFDAEAIFVGHGITAPEFDWDDYKDVDVKGKIVVAFTNEPPSDDPKFFAGKALTYYGRHTYRFEEAARRGAKACFIIHTKQTAGYPYAVVQTLEGAQLKREPGQPALEFAGWLSSEMGEKLLGMSGRTVEGALKEADAKGFKSYPLGVRLKGHVPTQVQKFASNNVVGIAEGSDPALKSEAVIFTAHWDHLGVGRAVAGDSVYNGAADNATGCALVLEMARAWCAQFPRPKRSAIFLAVTAEEKGLLGSKHYARNPLVPLGKTALNLNFDMILPLGEFESVVATGADRTTAYPLFQRAAQRNGLEVEVSKRAHLGGYFRSDHFSFARAGVPAFSVGAGTKVKGKSADAVLKIRDDFNEQNYHSPQDEVQPHWDYSGFVVLARFALDLARDVANAERLPTWNAGDEYLPLREKQGVK